MATSVALAPIDTLSHAAPTLCMNVPMSESRSATNRLLKIDVRKGRQNDSTRIDYPNVKEYTSTPASRNSISNCRSTMGVACRIS